MLNLDRLFRLRTLRRAAFAIAVCCASSALAQTGNPTTGATLYAQRAAPGSGVSCQDCHGFAGNFRALRLAGLNEAAVFARVDGAIRGNTGQMATFSSWMTAQQRTDVAAYIVTAPAPTPPPPFAPLPTPTATPSPVMFSSTEVGSTSATVTVLVTNNSTIAATFANPAVVPSTGHVGDFKSAPVAAGLTECPISGGTLEPGVSCSIGAQFAPTVSGSRSATWNVRFTGNVPARELTLQGTANAATTPAPPSNSANAPSGGGALGWMNLLGMLVLLGVARNRG
jgi:trimeric autotransporter adhesin